MLRVENISAGYGKKQVLYDISFSVEKAEIVLLAGSNGSGKSTLLKCIFGLLPLWNGEVIFNNETIHSATHSKSNTHTSTLIRLGLMYIPQKNNLFEDLTVKENLQMAGLALDQKLLKQRIEYSLSIFTSLTPHLQRTPMKLSGGERQLLTLAMAILHQPRMILLDEPFAGLAPKNIHFISDNLKMLNERNGTTLLIVEHRVKECLNIVNRVISLKLGRVFSGSEVNQNFSLNQLHETFI